MLTVAVSAAPAIRVLPVPAQGQAGLITEGLCRAVAQGLSMGH